MKTMTEFDPFRVNKVVQLLADLETQGKTPEERETAVGEALKLEGDKLKLIIKTAEHMKGKTDGLRKVVVMLGAEGEVGPPKSIQVDSHFLVLEYFQSMKKADGDDRDKKDGKRGGKGGGRNERGGGGGRNERGGAGGGAGGGRGPGGPGGDRGGSARGPKAGGSSSPVPSSPAKKA